MNYLKSLMPILLMLCAFCKKDSPSQVEQLLIDGTWTQTAYLTDDDGDGVFTDTSLPCQFGDAWVFTADQKFELRDEIDYCDPDVDSVFTYAGTWELRDNDTEIYVEIDPDFLFYNFKIHSISDTLIELRQYNTPASQAPLEERFILRR